MRIIPIIILTLSCASAPSPPVLVTYADFYERYPVQKLESQPTPASTDMRVELAPRFDEAGTYAGFHYAASVRAVRDVFRFRALEERPRRDAAFVRRAIDETLGVSLLGRGFAVEQRTPMAGGVDRLDFRFGNKNFGQALVGRPATPNGVLLVALHGCWLSPDPVMTEERSYANSFGLRALEQGYTVVAPYVVSQCRWIHNLDYLGSMSGVSTFGYELAKISELTQWAKREYGVGRVVVWGISLGAQYAMLLSALHPNIYNVTVISGGAGDYEGSYLESFDKAGLNAEDVIGANTQVLLSSRVARRDVIGAILPRPIIFEVSTNDLNDGAMAMITHADWLAKQRRGLVDVVLFKGLHETAPSLTLPALARVLRLTSPPNR